LHPFRTIENEPICGNIVGTNSGINFFFEP
jgi:hypothetical protein